MNKAFALRKLVKSGGDKDALRPMSGSHIRGNVFADEQFLTCIRFCHALEVKRQGEIHRLERSVTTKKHAVGYFQCALPGSALVRMPRVDFKYSSPCCSPETKWNTKEVPTFR